MTLSRTELDLIGRHESRLMATSAKDELMERYYRGRQRIEQLGMAIPPEMRRFLVVANWPRTVADTINQRQQVQSMSLPGRGVPDDDLARILAASNFPVQVSMFNLCRLIYGRAVMSVGTNEDAPDLPLVRAESPREVSVIVDARREAVASACRFYYSDDVSRGNVAAPGASGADLCVLYLPDVTIWCQRTSTGWVEVDRDEHLLGAVPVAVHYNRRLPGQWQGESQMTDVIPLADSAARSLTNMQFAQEAHGIPRIFLSGVTRGDFLDSDGKPVPMFEAYFDAMNTLTSKDARAYQMTAADLKNFETAMDVYGRQASVVTGFPARYFGLHTANPPAEGAIYADEAPVNRSVEQQNEDVGVTLGHVGALALRLATNKWPDGRRVHVQWVDPATPTVSQREDALSKRRAAGVLSREGYWDELGWSEERKAKERAYFEAEERDPYLERLGVKDAVAGASTVG